MISLQQHISIAIRYLDNCVNGLSTTNAAHTLIDGFIRVSRTLRNTHTSEVSIHDIGTAFTLARAHAALCFKPNVQMEDALIAIYLLEESLLNRTGRSVLHFSRSLSVNKCNLDMFDKTPADCIREFGVCVMRFLQSHGIQTQEE